MKIAVVGYGNLGKAIAKRQAELPGFELVGIFSRRKVKSEFARVFAMGELDKFKGKLDALLLAGGSSGDLPIFSPKLAESFNIVDSFDTHAGIKEHYERVDAAAKSGKTSAIISCGWDPGLFSVIRFFGKSFLSPVETASFWGRGVSQGHSEAIKRIDGVLHAIEYTVPKELYVNKALSGERVNSKNAHLRECYVVAESEREHEIEEKIKNIPEYFQGYETRVHFIDEKEFLKRHNKAFHGGRVISFGKTSKEEKATALMDFKLEINSNPEFTAGIMLAYSRAVKHFSDLNIFGAKTPLQVPPSFLGGDIFNIL